MKLYDIVNDYWKPLSFVVVCIVLLTQAHGRLEATEISVSEHEQRLKLSEKKWQEFKEWLIRQEGREARNEQKFEDIQKQLVENAEQNKMLLQFLLKDKQRE